MYRTKNLRLCTKMACCLLLSIPPAFGWDVGFNFRATSGYVTDPSPTTWAIFGLTQYPTTRTVAGQQITFGWESTASTMLSRDRGTYAGPLLAGIHCQANDGTSSVFRVDLPSAGTYAIRLALGDGVGNYGRSNHVQVRSTHTTVLSVDANTLTNFADAVGTPWSPTSWPASNTAVQRSFGSSTLRMVIGGTVDSSYNCIAHIRVTLIQATQAALPGPRDFILQ